VAGRGGELAAPRLIPLYLNGRNVNILVLR
jgi:hypothetical protein